MNTNTLCNVIVKIFRFWTIYVDMYGYWMLFNILKTDLKINHLPHIKHSAVLSFLRVWCYMRHELFPPRSYTSNVIISLYNEKF